MALLIVASIGLALALVQYGKDTALDSKKVQRARVLTHIAVDETGHLVDGLSGEPVITIPEASLIKVKPDGDLVSRKLMNSMRSLVGTEDLVEAQSGGDEYLGTVSKSDVEAAYEKVTKNGESVQIQVQISGVTYTKSLNTDAISREENSESGRRRSRHLVEGDPTDDSDQPVTIVKGITLKEDPLQKFEVDCPEDGSNCEVYSLGEFMAPGERRLQQTDGARGQPCKDNHQCYEFGCRDCSCEYSGSRYQCERTCQNDGHCTEKHYSFKTEEWWTLEGTCRVNTFYRHAKIEDCARNRHFCYCSYCFSPESMVLTEHRGKIPMKKLLVGEKVLTSSGKYQKVFAFLHRVPEAVAEEVHYLRISTDNELTEPLELTNKHMVYLTNKKHPIEASRVKVGDYVQMLQPGMTAAKPVNVISIEHVYRKGAYTPATEDGTIVVGGIVASIYSNPRHTPTENVEVGGTVLMHRATFSHVLATPVRFACLYLNSNLCAIPDLDKESKMPGMDMIDVIYSLYYADFKAMFMAIMGSADTLKHILENLLLPIGIPVVALLGCLGRWIILRPVSCEKKKKKKVE